MLGVNIEKILKSIAPDLNIKDIAKESAKIPLMLGALIEQSNNQGKALEYIIKKLDTIDKKLDTIEEKINKAEELLEVS